MRKAIQRDDFRNAHPNTSRPSTKISDAFFDGTDFGKILKIDGGQSDKHQNGRCACIITAEHGQFLYKPRNLKADTVLYEMVSGLFSDIVAAETVRP